MLRPGDLLGEFEAVYWDGGPRTAGNVALEPVECLVLTGQDFRDFLDAHPRVPVVLLRALIRRLRAADKRRITVRDVDRLRRHAD